MYKNKGSISRRNFLKTAGALGAGSLLLPLDSLTAARAESNTKESKLKVVPTRPFGKTGVDVPILCLGHAFGLSSNLLIKQAFNMGVRLWDTASTYLGGDSEKAIGKYFAKFPEDRKGVFLLTKSWSLVANAWGKNLKKSLERMNTSYIDLFLIHGIDLFEELLPYKNSVRWAERAKSEGKIRFFGFSTHTNMERNLMKASKHGWIDGIMFSYNFRNMYSKKMKKAIDACSKAGIGLIAMKTQASGHYFADKIAPNKKEKEFFDHFGKKGLTFEQAKLKAVWEDERIASITSGITNMAILQANVAAAVNDIKLSWRDKQLMNQYARYTASNYCTGCASICETQINNEVPISDVMRFLMYARCYGELENAKSIFNKLPLNVRKRMAHIDYKEAEKKCPQHMEIGRHMREATTELA
jgi:predicted aldo/keto reductase-like oxidoreductase